MKHAISILFFLLISLFISCQNDETIRCNIENPTAEISPTVFSGTTIYLKTPNYYIPNVTYEWTGPNNFHSNEQNPVISNASAAMSGEYKLIIKIGAQAGLTTAFGSTINPADSSLNNRNLLPNIIDVNKAFYELPTATFSPGAGITGGYNDMRFTLRYNQGLTNVLRFTETNNYDQSNRYIGPSFKGTFSSISFTVAYNL
jgi:hypothetical protein